ncbi:putative signal transducing protein [Aquimarina macrocephali]|uniref:putative signal transducing protein n=1 Tax=Aquimarina macrocephali TaxID=666563 RepID=UPI003F665644
MSETFKTVAVFQYSAEALIIKGRIESEGIQVFTMDMHTIDTDPLVSNAIGGVKLRVKAEDEQKALQIIESIQEYAIDDQGESICCPNCNGKKIVLDSTIDSLKSLVLLLLFMLPINQKTKYRCEDCNHKFYLK